MEAWSQFFIRAGIPKDISGRYAKSFVENRITKEMLPDLDKPTLSELGVSAIGDQLLILRRIKAAKSTLSRTEELNEKPKSSNRERITGPTDYTQASQHRKGKPPPDSHEIYHVKMPVGNTARTQKILEKAHKMRQNGLAVRGTTGVRQGGRSVSPIDKSSLAARMKRKNQFGSSEVSSSTDRRSQLGNRVQKITSNNSRIQKNTGIRIQVTNDNRRVQKHAPIVVTTSNNRRQRVQYYDEDDNDADMVTVGYEEANDEEEEIYEVEDVEFEEDEEEEQVQVRSRPRITFSNDTTASTSSSRRYNTTSAKNDSIFNRVSFR